MVCYHMIQFSVNPQLIWSLNKEQVTRSLSITLEDNYITLICLHPSSLRMINLIIYLLSILHNSDSSYISSQCCVCVIIYLRIGQFVLLLVGVHVALLHPSEVHVLVFLVINGRLHHVGARVSTGCIAGSGTSLHLHFTS